MALQLIDHIAARLKIDSNHVYGQTLKYSDVVRSYIADSVQIGSTVIDRLMAPLYVQFSLRGE